MAGRKLRTSVSDESAEIILLKIKTLNKVANREHIKLLKSSVARWNTWRESNPNIVPDLDRVDFNGADLSNANLRKANFYMTLLNGANLQGANLTKTFFASSDLRGANLNETDCS